MVREHRYLYLEDILAVLEQDYTVEGDVQDVKITGIHTLDDAGESSLIWIKPTVENKLKIIQSTAAKAIICDFSFDADEDILASKCLIRVREPKYAVINVINSFFKKVYQSALHTNTVISPTAKIAEDVFIGANSFIGDEVEIRPGVIIEGNCYIYEKTVIAENVVIQAGAIIGSDGFGHYKSQENKLIHFPHIGRVVIESEVHIGSNSVIDRGVLGDTRIGRGTKINKMCVISHNVRIGSDNFIAHSVCINGSAMIGNNNFIGSGAIIKNKVAIGDNTVIGMGSVVVDNIDDNCMVYGNPAKETDRKPNKPLF